MSNDFQAFCKHQAECFFYGLETACVYFLKKYFDLGKKTVYTIQ